MIAFYAPLKSPDHDTPSGDRLIARQLMSALSSTDQQVQLASRFRSFDPHGDRQRQARIKRLGARIAARLIARYQKARAAQRPKIWFTYHLYHKAPDWLGPKVAKALGIPYLVAEASYAPKQANGPWAIGHEGVANALSQADLVLGFNRSDAACVLPLLADERRYRFLKAFIDPTPYQRAARQKPLFDRRPLNIAPHTPLLLSVAMMRKGAKLASFRLLAGALQRIKAENWHLLIAGDGPARPEVEELFAPLTGRITLLGLQTPEQLATLYVSTDLFVWPSIDEALGMVFLEAQASGLPVIGAKTGGVPDLVEHGQSGLLVPVGDEAAFATAIKELLADEQKRTKMGQTAMHFVTTEHSLDSARAALAQLTNEVLACSTLS